MIYAIIGLFVIAALFLIFREDHDNSYDKSEKGSRKKAAKKPKVKADNFHYQKEQPKAEQPKASKKPSGPSLKEQIVGEIEQAIKEAKEGIQDPLAAVREAMDMAKDAIDSSIRDSRKGWNFTPANVDVQEESEEEPDLSFLDTLDYYDSLADNTETFDIAGLRYHCTVHDCGKIAGYVKPDPSNVHDNRAQAVIRSDGKLLGYIPRTQQNWYEDFNEHNVVCPFIGQIELDRSSAQLVAEIKVIIPSRREFVLDEIVAGL